MKEIPELRAPEKRRTGIEIRPNVRYPDQTEAAISFAPECHRFLKYAKRRKCSLQPTSSDLARKKERVPQVKAPRKGYPERASQ